MAELLARIGSAELAEWIAELSLRDREEREALAKASAETPQRPRVMGT